jgi:hypothetical protein
VAQPEKAGEVPWTDLLLLLGGAVGWEGSRRGYHKAKAHREKKKSQPGWVGDSLASRATERHP